MKTLNYLASGTFARLAKNLGISIHKTDSSLVITLDELAEYLEVYLWDWEYGIIKIANLQADEKIGDAILRSTTHGESELRTKTSRFSHICIHLKVIKRMHIYRADVDDVLSWEDPEHRVEPNK